MTTPLVRVCVTGPESTGKTTLAHRLADWAATACVPEAARRYAERVKRELLASDVGLIGREHVALADRAAEAACERGVKLLVLDQDLISTQVYGRYYYGAAPRWIERVEPLRRADLYLLCDVDVPWIPDGVRDRPADRAGMFARFQRALARRRANLVVVRGDWEARWIIAREAVTSLLAGTVREER